MSVTSAAAPSSPTNSSFGVLVRTAAQRSGLQPLGVAVQRPRFAARTQFRELLFVGGTSMPTPHVALVMALMLQKNPTLTSVLVESILKLSALPIPPVSSRLASDFDHLATIMRDTTCGALGACDAVGAGLVQADARSPGHRIPACATAHAVPPRTTCTIA